MLGETFCKKFPPAPPSKTPMVRTASAVAGYPHRGMTLFVRAGEGSRDLFERPCAQHCRGAPHERSAICW